MERDVFSYLEKDYRYLNNYIKDINELLFTEPHSSIIKGRIFAEHLSQEVAKLEGFGLLSDITQIERLRKLQNETDLGYEASDLFHQIRKIGNIAAHSEVEGELESALIVHKCVYKLTCWFVEVYIDPNFEAEPYKSPKPNIINNNDNNIVDLISKVNNLINITKETGEINVNKNIDTETKDEVSVDKECNNEITKERNKECLIQELTKLKESSKEAVEGLNKFSDFKKYMHITRDVQEELEDLILKAYEIDGSQLILVCGSVGDGKSHIISYFKDKYPEIMSNFTLHNDATESLEPDKTSIDTLNQVLDNFSDENINNSNQKLILAINLGTLNNFIDSHYSDRFTIFKKFVNDKKILETSITDNKFNEDNHIQFVNFCDYHLFTLKDGEVRSNYIKSLIKKITDKSEYNNFYRSYKNNCSKCKNNNRCPVKSNYELLSEETVQDSIVDLLVQCIIKNKIIISTRALINFMYELIVARSYIDVNSPMFKDKIYKLKNEEYINSLTPNIIFDHKELSFIFESLNALDPLNIRNEKVDDFIIKFNNSNDLINFFNDYIDYPKGYIDKISDIDFEIETKKIKRDLLKLFIRSYYLCGKGELFSLKDHVYEKFIMNLYYWNKGDKSKLKGLYNEIKEGIVKWNGEADKKYINIFLGKNQVKYKVSEELELKADVSNLPLNNEIELIKFLNDIEIKYKGQRIDKSFAIDIDFSLYELLNKVINGYRPNKKDKNHFIKFIEFINKIEESGSQDEQIIFTEKNREENKKFRLEYDNEFEQYKFMEI